MKVSLIKKIIKNKECDFFRNDGDILKVHNENTLKIIN